MFYYLKSFAANPWRFLLAYSRRRRETGLQRWSDPESLDPLWNKRTEDIAKMIQPNSSVFEFGAGKEVLGEYLPQGCEYQPCDLVKRSENTMIWDLNKGFPELDKHYDYMVFSGVIEYIYDLGGLFAKVREYSNTCIVSYETMETLDCITSRFECGWVNHVSKDEIEAVFEKAGWDIHETKPWQGQTLYVLK